MSENRFPCTVWYAVWARGCVTQAFEDILKGGVVNVAAKIVREVLGVLEKLALGIRGTSLGCENGRPMVVQSGDGLAGARGGVVVCVCNIHVCNVFRVWLPSPQLPQEVVPTGALLLWGE